MLTGPGVVAWQVVVPVKATLQAKSRLVAVPNRAALAEAFALDTVAALIAAATVERVFVVTPRTPLSRQLAALGARIVFEGAAEHELAEHEARPADDPSGHDRLNAAINCGILAVRQSNPTANLMVVTGDLPALRADDIVAACELAARQQRAMVPDANGAGTTTLFARDGFSLRPRFGVQSRAKHVSDGHTVLVLPPGSPLRLDVDTATDLARARALGVGTHTNSLLVAG